MKKEILSNCTLCNSKKIYWEDSNGELCYCSDCGLCFNNPRPTLEMIQKFYSRPEKIDSWMGREETEDAWDRLAIRRFNHVKRYKSTGTILDIGCGIGRFLNVAKTSFEVYGTEISRNPIRIAKERYGIGNIKFGNFDELDFNNRTFDVITLWHVLEHVPYPGKTLNKAKGLLKRNGLLFIAVPNDDGFWLSRRLKNFLLSLIHMEADKKNKIQFDISLNFEQKEIHLSHFNEQVLSDFLASIGYEITYQGLDAYYVSSGAERIKNFVTYQICALFGRIFGVNLYKTILISAMNS